MGNFQLCSQSHWLLGKQYSYPHDCLAAGLAVVLAVASVTCLRGLDLSYSCLLALAMP